MFRQFVKWLGQDVGITPNQITLGRIPFFVLGLLMWIYKHKLAQSWGIDWVVVGSIAFAIVTLVIVLDILDGALARETGQVTEFGKIIDPLVDKTITYTTLAIFWKETNLYAFGILFALDLLSTALRSISTEGANLWGKRKALLQNASKLFFGLAVLTETPELNLIGNGLLWVAVLFASTSVGIRIMKIRFLRKLIPQLITAGNLCCGLASIMLALENKITFAVNLVYLAMVFDMFDGIAARKLNAKSKFGGIFDSIADFVSFGIAPAIIVLEINLWDSMAMFATVIYLFCIIARLWDYEKNKTITPLGFFRGLPSPAAAWLIIASTIITPPFTSVFAEAVMAVLMVNFNTHWPKFSSVKITPLEGLIAGIIGGIVLGKTQPIGFLMGPILVYIGSFYWRKPEQIPETAT